MERPTNRSYTIRGSRITEAQKAAKDALWLTYGIAYTQEKVDLASLFPEHKKLVIEIGFGMGEATAHIAQQLPDTAFVAIDLHPPGIGKLLGRIDEGQLKNIKVIEEDAHMVLHYMIEDKSIDGFHLYFPDPWPKKKHNKRRIVNPEFIEVIHSKLKPGGYFHIATDWVPYAERISEVFSVNDLFSGGVVAKPEWRPLTRFEGQGLDKKHRVTDFMYFR